MNQPFPTTTLPSGATSPIPDVCSPAEQKFWQEQAERSPALIRKEIVGQVAALNDSYTPYKLGAVAVGAALGIATFTKHVKGRWKWATGAAAVTSLGLFSALNKFSHITDHFENQLGKYANALERDPQLRDKLANFLASTVTAEDIQQHGLDMAVANKAGVFAEHTPYLQILRNDGPSR